MISKVPRNLKFGNADDIQWLHKWQALGPENKQLLIDMEKPALTAFEVQITKPKWRYEVLYYPREGQAPRIQYASSVRGVWRTIEEFNIERRIIGVGDDNVGVEVNDE